MVTDQIHHGNLQKRTVTKFVEVIEVSYFLVSNKMRFWRPIAFYNISNWKQSKLSISSVYFSKKKSINLCDKDQNLLCQCNKYFFRFHFFSLSLLAMIYYWAPHDFLVTHQISLPLTNIWKLDFIEYSENATYIIPIPHAITMLL